MAKSPYKCRRVLEGVLSDNDESEAAMVYWLSVEEMCWDVITDMACKQNTPWALGMSPRLIISHNY